MSFIKENVVKAAQDDVRFRIVIPAGSLSFKDYVKGNRMILALGLRRVPLRICSMIIGIILGVASITGFRWMLEYSDLRFVAAGWHGNTEEYFFFVNDLSALSLFLQLFLAGAIVTSILIRCWNYKLYRVRYRSSNSINAGYWLELMECGICAVSLADDGMQTWRNFTGWGNVVDVIHGKGVDFIVCQAGSFLWIPTALEESLRSEVMAFIEQKRADAAKSKGNAL